MNTMLKTEENLQSSADIFYDAVSRTKPVGKLFFKWCWSGLLLGSIWLAYRKMYKLAFGFLLLEILPFYFLAPVLPDFNRIDCYYILSHLIVGTLGVSIYMKYWKINPMPHRENRDPFSAIGIYFLSAFIPFFLGIILFEINSTLLEAENSLEIEQYILKRQMEHKKKQSPQGRL